MLKRKQPGAMARGIAADTPVQEGPAAQHVEPLAPAGAVARYLRRSRIHQEGLEGSDGGGHKEPVLM
jgi:hypothetical protein